MYFSRLCRSPTDDVITHMLQVYRLRHCYTRYAVTVSSSLLSADGVVDDVITTSQ